MIVEYLEKSFSENEKEEILNLFKDYEIQFYCKKPEIRQAAFDELVGQVIIFLSSNEVTAIVNGMAIIGSIVGIIKFIIKKSKQKKFTTITVSSKRVCPMNVIIQVDNIRIIQPENADEISIDDYLEMALSLVASSGRSDLEMIISYNDGLHFETLEQYVLRKTKIIMNSGSEK